jgi:phosphoglycolate phosphatase
MVKMQVIFFYLCYNGMMNFRCVIFDLDGTLADTIHDVAAKINKALEERGFAPAPVEEYIKMQGKAIEELVLNALPAEARDRKLAQELGERAVEIYEEDSLYLAKPYPGMTELLLELKQKKRKTAVLSNKPHGAAVIEISHLFPAYNFDMVSGVRAGFPFKPDPVSVWDLLTNLDVSPRDALLMGDSETDIKTALAAGCHAMGVSWGYRDVSVLKAAGAQRIINKPSELMEFI